MAKVLRGITWDHARGFEPMAATAAAFSRRRRDIRIRWEKRSLQAFGDSPLSVLAEEYDLLVIDHPHCGEAAAAGCLVPLDETRPAAELDALAAGSVGRSHGTYSWGGHQWALAIDAAAHVCAYRPDLLPSPPSTWTEVIELAHGGRVLWPIRPVDSMMSFFTVAAALDLPVPVEGSHFLAPAAILDVLEPMSRLARHVPAECRNMSPIHVLELLAASDQHVYCPLLFGYSNYARTGFREKRLRFGSIPAFEGCDPHGSILGGAGIAVSARCRDVATAVDYAFEVAGAECQRGLYFASGGQPAHTAAWDCEANNAACDEYLRATRPMLERAYVRPRHDGYLQFQREGGRAVHGCLTGKIGASEAAGRLRDSFLAARLTAAARN